MALIKCPECGREISDKAVSCPGCGFSLNNYNIGVGEASHDKTDDLEDDYSASKEKYESEIIEDISVNKLPSVKNKTKGKRIVFIIPLCVIAILAIVVAAIFGYKSYRTKKEYQTYKSIYLELKNSNKTASLLTEDLETIFLCSETDLVEVYDDLNISKEDAKKGALAIVDEFNLSMDAIETARNAEPLEAIKTIKATLMLLMMYSNSDDITSDGLKNQAQVADVYIVSKAYRVNGSVDEAKDNLKRIKSMIDDAAKKYPNSEYYDAINEVYELEYEFFNNQTTSEADMIKEVNKFTKSFDEKISDMEAKFSE